MEYNIAYFQNKSYRRYETFLIGFSEKCYKTVDFIGNSWWFSENPLNGYLLFAYTKEEIVSRCVITERRLRYKNNVISCFEIGGLCTLPQHQRRGLCTRLVKKAVELGFDSGPKLIYGTSNARSGPVYRKLNYSFVDIENSYLILLMNSFNPLLKKIGLRKDKPILNKRERGHFKPLLKSLNVAEITFDQYKRATKPFKRMNEADDDYLERRLSVGLKNQRRFFYGTSKNQEFYCAFKDYKLGYLRTILVSEYFLNGNLDHSCRKFNFLRTIASRYYQDYDGIYLKSVVRKSWRKYLDMLRYKYIVHRKLPVNYSFCDLPEQQVSTIMSNIVKVFQMTDCDIG